jgi:hypothetical protein
MRKLVRVLPEMVLSSVALALAGLFVPIVVARAAAQSQDQECRRHLRAIYQAIQRYRADHHGEYPPSLTAPPRFRRDQPPVDSLVPRYLAADQVMCPADPSEGVKPGWQTRFSYIYGVQELRSPSPLVRQRVRTGLIDRFGPNL